MPSNIADVVSPEEEIFERSSKLYHINTSGDNKDFFLDYIRGEIEKEEYNLNLLAGPRKNQRIHFDLLVDKVLMYAILTKKKDVRTHEANGEGIIIINDCDLKYIRTRSTIDEWHDRNLFTLWDRRIKAKRKFKNTEHASKLMTYIEIFDEIGQHIEVEKVWGRKLVYKVDANSPNVRPYHLGRNR